jgi:hypothetical protein
MTRVFRGCVFGTVMAVLLVLCGASHVYSAEFVVNIETQRLESNSESFPPRVGLFYSSKRFSSFPTRNEFGVYTLSYDYSQRNHSLTF